MHAYDATYAMSPCVTLDVAVGYWIQTSAHHRQYVYTWPSLHVQGAAFAIWTTTPWTIPANLAIAVNDQLEYAVVEAQVRQMRTTRLCLNIIAQYMDIRSP